MHNKNFCWWCQVLNISFCDDGNLLKENFKFLKGLPVNIKVQVYLQFLLFARRLAIISWRCLLRLLYAKNVIFSVTGLRRIYNFHLSYLPPPLSPPKWQSGLCSPPSPSSAPWTPPWRGTPSGSGCHPPRPRTSRTAARWRRPCLRCCPSLSRPQRPDPGTKI